MANSPDGVRWTTDPEMPLCGSRGARFGNVCTIHYDYTFVVVTRHWLQTVPTLNPRNPVGPTNPGPR